MKCFKTISNTLQAKFFKEQLGKEDISTIGDGTILGAIKYLSSKDSSSISSSELEDIKKNINNIDTKLGTTDIKKYGTNITNAIDSLGDKVSKIQSSSGNSCISTCDVLWINSTEDNHNFYQVSKYMEYNVFNYNFISIYYKDFLYYSTDERCYVTGLFPYSSFGKNLTLISNIDILRSRVVSFNSEGNYVNFSDCTGNSTYNNSTATTYPSYCVPIAIYGYK